MSRFAVEWLIPADAARLTHVMLLEVNSRLTQKGEVFRGHDVSLNSLSNLLTRLITTPGLHVRASLGVSRGQSGATRSACVAASSQEKRNVSE